jgi:SRSO17 transposase
VITCLTYLISLLLSTGKKTCESMGEIANLSGDTMLRMLNTDVSLKEKCELVNKFFNNKILNAVVDDVVIEKKHSKNIEGTSYNFDSSSHTSYQSLCSVVVMLTDGFYHIPIAHQLWISEEIMTDAYEKKYQIAIRAIRSILEFCKIRTVIADALYALVEFMQELNQLQLRFEMKIHSNRVVILKSGEKISIRDAFRSKLKKKEWRTIQVIWKELSLYITAHKRYNKHDVCKIIYQVSNFVASASMHVRTYGYRWSIEKLFRTAKQSLGLKDCQSRSAIRQTHHINKVFMAYTILQVVRRKQKLKTPEAALRWIKKRGFKSLSSYLAAPSQIFAAIFF